MSRRPPASAFAVPLLLVVAVATPGPVRADSITLKSGNVISGEIIGDTPDKIVIEYFATPTIKDQKTFPRDLIASVVTEPADEKAWKALGPLASPSILLNSSFHDLLIERKIPLFLSKYPYSRHVPQLRASLSTLDAERTRLREGDLKINGVWLSAAEINADPYQSGAKIKYAEMKQRALANNHLGVLQSCELLEKDYPGSSVLPEAIELALDQIKQLQESLNKSKDDFDVLNNRRQKALALAAADQVREIKEALEVENQNAKIAISNSLASGSKFFPVFPNNKESMDALQTLITAENARWTLLSKTPMRDGIRAAKECLDAIAKKDLKAAQEQLAISEKLWPANAENAKLRPLVEALAKTQATAEAAAKKAPSPTPTASPQKP